MGECKRSILGHALWDGIVCVASGAGLATGEGSIAQLLIGLAGLIPSAWLGTSIILQRIEMRDAAATVLK